MNVLVPIPDAWGEKLVAYCTAKNLTRTELLRTVLSKLIDEPIPAKKKVGRKPKQLVDTSGEHLNRNKQMKFIINIPQNWVTDITAKSLSHNATTDEYMQRVIAHILKRPLSDVVTRKSRAVDITGVKYNQLTAIKYLGHLRWLFRCDCGVEKSILAKHVKSGVTKSCGCLLRK